MTYRASTDSDASNGSHCSSKSPCISESAGNVVESASHLSPASSEDVDAVDAPLGKAADLTGAGLAPPPGAKDPWSVIPRSSADGVLAASRPAMPTLAAIEASPHYPVVVTPNPGAPGFVFDGKADPRQHLALNGPEVPIDSDIFEGKLVIHMKGLPTTNKSVFDGKKRLVHVVAQGKFKRRVRASALVTGQEFHVPIVRGSGVEWFLEQLLRTCGKVMSKTTIVNARGDSPSFYNPLIAACQLINVARDGEEPDMLAAEEDCRLMHPALADINGQPMAAALRRRWCDDAANAAGLVFEPGLVYTLHLWQDLLCFAGYRLRLGPLALDLARVLASQPLQLAVKDLDSGGYVYSALVWHERLLYPDEAAAKGRARAAAAGSLPARLSSGLRSLKLLH